MGSRRFFYNKIWLRLSRANAYWAVVPASVISMFVYARLTHYVGRAYFPDINFPGSGYLGLGATNEGGRYYQKKPIRVFHAQATELFPRVEVRPYSVLGAALKEDGSVEQVAPEPLSPRTVAVDPAGLHHILTTPAGAAGAAGAIYKWLGEEELPQGEPFPADVRDNLLGVTNAWRHCYAGGEKCVIHAVGPDLRTKRYGVPQRAAESRIVSDLAATYQSVFREYAEHLKPELKGYRHDEYEHFSGAQWGVLRLPPVSSGIFAGRFKERMPELTVMALSAALDSLPQNARRALAIHLKRVELCVFDAKEVPLYEEEVAFEQRRQAARAHELSVLRLLEHNDGKRKEEVGESLKFGFPMVNQVPRSE